MRKNFTSYLLLACFLMLGTSSCILLPPTCVPTAPTPADNGNVCDPGSRTLSWPSVTDATTYDVYLNAGTAAPTSLVSADQTGTSYVATLALGDYTWQVIPKNSAGAPTGCAFWTFHVVTSVAPTISVTGNNIDTFCAGTPVTFTAATTNGGTAPFYQWKKNNVNVGTNSSTYVDNTILTGDVIKATLTSNSTACLTTNIVTSAPDTIKSIIPGVPVVDINAEGDTSFCMGGSVKLSTTATVTTGTYQWRRNGADIAGENNTFMYAYTTGDYDVKVNIAGGRCASTSRSVAVKAVTVYPHVNRSGNTLSTDAIYSAYQWYKNSQAISGATTATYTVIADGNYSVKTVDNLGCSGSSAFLPVNNLAVGTVVNVEDVQVYPNPTNGIVNINSPVLLNVSVLDMQGKVVLKKNAVSKIDMGGLANGIYVMQLSDKNNTIIKVEKLIKKDL